eukprot:scaffold235183_cov30-Tisochrysis_lutea.AAC.1
MRTYGAPVRMSMKTAARVVGALRHGPSCLVYHERQPALCLAVHSLLACNTCINLSMRRRTNALSTPSTNSPQASRVKGAGLLVLLRSALGLLGRGLLAHTTCIARAHRRATIAIAHAITIDEAERLSRQQRQRRA